MSLDLDYFPPWLAAAWQAWEDAGHGGPGCTGWWLDAGHAELTCACGGTVPMAQPATAAEGAA